MEDKKILYIALIVLGVSILGLSLIHRIREDNKKIDELRDYKYDPKKAIDPKYHRLFDLYKQ